MTSEKIVGESFHLKHFFWFTFVHCLFSVYHLCIVYQFPWLYDKNCTRVFTSNANKSNCSMRRICIMLWYTSKRAPLIVLLLINCLPVCDIIYWATSWEKLSYAICKQQSAAPLFSLPRKYIRYSCYTRHFKILSSFRSLINRFVSFLVAFRRRQVFSWPGSYHPTEEKKRGERVAIKCFIGKDPLLSAVKCRG